MFVLHGVIVGILRPCGSYLIADKFVAIIVHFHGRATRYIVFVEVAIFPIVFHDRVGNLLIVVILGQFLGNDIIVGRCSSFQRQGQAIRLVLILYQCTLVVCREEEHLIKVRNCRGAGVNPEGDVLAPAVAIVVVVPLLCCLEGNFARVVGVGHCNVRLRCAVDINRFHSLLHAINGFGHFELAVHPVIDHVEDHLIAMVIVGNAIDLCRGLHLLHGKLIGALVGISRAFVFQGVI